MDYEALTFNTETRSSTVGRFTYSGKFETRSAAVKALWRTRIRNKLEIRNSNRKSAPGPVGQTVKTVENVLEGYNTPLKRGVNERLLVRGGHSQDLLERGSSVAHTVEGDHA